MEKADKKNYTIKDGGGWGYKLEIYTTFLGAKQAATKWATFDGKSVTIFLGENPIAIRKFWQQFNKFGWKKWEYIV